MKEDTRKLVAEIYRELAELAKKIPSEGKGFLLSDLMENNLLWKETSSGIHSAAGGRFFDYLRLGETSYDDKSGIGKQPKKPWKIKLNGRWFEVYSPNEKEKPVPYYIKALSEGGEL